MCPPADADQGSNRRMQKRIAVGLAMLVRGVERDGTAFEDSTQSYNISRTGASFTTARQLEVGMELEIIIPGRTTPRGTENDFIAQARIVRILPGKSEAEKTIGVQFVGPRFHRIFVSESTG